MTHSEHPIVWLTHAGQRLGLVPSLGGGVAAWQLERRPDLLDLWRPWDGRNLDMYSLASFAMLPWSNRISKGGFDHDGQFYPMVCNRVGEPYPIHGDGWLQPWTLKQPADDTLIMSLQSHQFGGNPYEYEATQTFRLVSGGLDQTVRVTHTGFDPLPYGLGLHPWFAHAAHLASRRCARSLAQRCRPVAPDAHHGFPARLGLGQRRGRQRHAGGQRVHGLVWRV